MKGYTNTKQYVNYEWGAGYLERGTSGSEGGSRKPTANSGKAPFPYPTTSTYVQGVEVETGYSGIVPEGFERITLPAAEYLAVQGEPFQEEDYAQAILSVQYSMSHYDPSIIGYEWDDSNPRIQLEPRGERGYIEMRAIKRRA